MSKPWFRLYSEFVSDPKVQLLAFEDQRHFVALLCLKCNGTLDASSGNLEHRERMIAKALGLDISTATEVRRRLDEANLIAPDWTPLRWSERQYESDTSTARTHRYRERLKQAKRHGDVTVTDKIRSDSEQSRAEQTKNTTARKRAKSDENPEGFAEFRQIFPKRAGSQPWHRAVRAWRARVAEGVTPSDIIAGAKRYAAFIAATGRERTETVLQASTFLGPDKHYENLYPAPAKPETAWDEMKRLNGGMANGSGRIFDAEQAGAVVGSLGGPVRG